MHYKSQQELMKILSFLKKWGEIFESRNDNQLNEYWKSLYAPDKGSKPSIKFKIGELNLEINSVVQIEGIINLLFSEYGNLDWDSEKRILDELRETVKGKQESLIFKYTITNDLVHFLKSETSCDEPELVAGKIITMVGLFPKLTEKTKNQLLDPQKVYMEKYGKGVKYDYNTKKFIKGDIEKLYHNYIVVQITIFCNRA